MSRPAQAAIRLNQIPYYHRVADFTIHLEAVLLKH
jgi:hypothetical protein